MKLKDAIDLYKQEESTPSNAYSWYRKSAKDSGKISIGGVDIPTYKDGKAWCVDEKVFLSAIAQHRAQLEKINQNTRDLANGIIHGNDGDTIYTHGGGYRIVKNFRYVWSDLLRARQKSEGSWYCNECNTIAETENNNEECHLCQDWNGCGRDCTLSRVTCPKCHRSITM